jgi:hypothetical protein
MPGTIWNPPPVEVSGNEETTTTRTSGHACWALEEAAR